MPKTSPCPKSDKQDANTAQKETFRILLILARVLLSAPKKLRISCFYMYFTMVSSMCRWNASVFTWFCATRSKPKIEPIRFSLKPLRTYVKNPVRPKTYWQTFSIPVALVCGMPRRLESITVDRNAGKHNVFIRFWTPKS